MNTALENEMKKNNVRLIKEKAVGLIINDGICCGVVTDKAQYSSETVLIATGGASYPLTGSTGDGYRFAQLAGHKITPIVPSLVPLETEEKYCRDLNGLALKNVSVTLTDKNKPVFCELGEMSFTFFGITGPLILTASSRIRNMEKDRYKILIDLKPGLSEEKLDKRIQRDFTEMSNSEFRGALVKLLPSKLIPVIVKLSGIVPDIRVNQITKAQRLELVRLIKKFPLTISDFRPVEEAIVTSGGVNIKEVDPKTMESKLVKGLYFAGEVLDVDGYTGGFNLQIAFSTGYVAGENL